MQCSTEMTVIIAKRKAVEALTEDTKRLRIEITSPLPLDGSDDEDDGSHDEDDNLISDEEWQDKEEDEDNTTSHPDGTNSPFTPVSPTTLSTSSKKSFPCTYPTCTKTFTRAVRRNAHLLTHSTDSSVSTQISCPHDQCSKTFSRRDHLNTHIREAHTHSDLHKCTYPGCTRAFGTSQRLNKHLASHTKKDKYRCTGHPPCSQSFLKHSTLSRHVRSEHLGLVPYPCTYVDEAGVQCQAGFDGSTGLRRHVRVAHGRPKFWCDECIDEGREEKGMGFMTRKELAKHWDEMHTNCMWCEMTFSSQKALAKHVDDAHTPATSTVLDLTKLKKEKTVMCTVPECGKGFTTAYNLRVHMRTVHSAPNAAPLFTCGTTPPTAFKDSILAAWDGGNACGRSLNTKANLEDHIRTQHLAMRSVVNAGRPKRDAGVEEGKTGRWKKPNEWDVKTGKAYLDRPLACVVEECQARFVREWDRKRHMVKEHGGESVEPASGEVIGPSETGYGGEMDIQGPCIIFGSQDEEMEAEWMGQGEEMMDYLIDPDLYQIGSVQSY